MGEGIDENWMGGEEWGEREGVRGKGGGKGRSKGTNHRANMHSVCTPQMLPCIPRLGHTGLPTHHSCTPGQHLKCLKHLLAQSLSHCLCTDLNQ